MSKKRKGWLLTENKIHDYAEKEKAVAKALGDLKANFYCELCDKQYHKHQEFDNHINSYDHAHKQRLKELKQREFARNVASKSWKDERKQKRALKRLHRLAELRRRANCDPGSGPNFRTTTVTATDQRQRRISLERDRGPGSRSFPATAQRPLPREQSLGRKKACHSACGCCRQRAGVSFCFSKKAQLKLESSASVFSDAVEEAGRDARHQRGRQGLEPFLSGIPSPRGTALDASGDEPERDQQREKTLGTQEPGRTPSTTADRQQSLTVLSSPLQRPSSAQLGQKAEAEADCADKSAGFASSVGQAKVYSSPLQGTARNQEPFQPQRSRETSNDLEDVKACFKDQSHRYATDREPAYPYVVLDGEINQHRASFVNVLGKDGETVLKWPAELLLHTKSEPCVSYSCNPLYHLFRRSRNERNSHLTVQAVDTDRHEVDRCAGGDESKEPEIHGHRENRACVSNPKRARLYTAYTAQNVELDTLSERRGSCMQNANSQTGSRGAFESAQTDTLQNKCVSARRHRLGKRKRPSKDETSNGGVAVTDLSLRSGVNPISGPSGEKKRRAESQACCGKSRSPEEGLHLGRPGSGHPSERRGERETPGTTFSCVSEPNSDSEGAPGLRRGRQVLTRGSWLDHSETASFSQAFSGWRSGDRSGGEGLPPSREQGNRACSKKKRFSTWQADFDGNARLSRWRRSPSSCSSSDTSDLSVEGVDQARRTSTEKAPVEDKRCSRKEFSFGNGPGFIKPPSVVKDTCDQCSAPGNGGKQCGPPPNRHALEPSDAKLPNDKSLIAKRTSSVMSLPLIGKIPAVRRNARRGDGSKTKSYLGQSPGTAAVSPGTLSAIAGPPLQGKVPGDTGHSPSPQRQGQQSKLLKTEGQMMCFKGEENPDSVPRVFLAEVCANSSHSARKEEYTVPRPVTKQHQGPESLKSTFNGGMYQEEEFEGAPEKPPRRSSPPLTEQPITFAPDEIDKYRHLQMQAQQHAQQQLFLGKQPPKPPSDLPAPIPALRPIQLPPPAIPVPISGFQRALLHQHRALAAFASTLGGPGPHPHLAALPPLPQPHFAPVPFSPLAPAVFATAANPPPAALHLVPASAFHQTHLALHTVSHGGLLPALLASNPITTAALHLRPLLHPLFRGQDLPPHTGPTG